MKAIAIGAFIAGLSATTAMAAEDVNSANSVLPGCKAFFEPITSDYIRSFKQGLCVGILPTLTSVLISGGGACIPSGVVDNQVIRVVIRYLDQRPERLHEEFKLLAMEAIHNAWPCKPSNQPSRKP
jgi:Rap1a immunity proteins